MTLLIDSLAGELSCGRLATLLEAKCLSASSLPTIMPGPLAVESMARITESGRTHDLVVGVEYGAGVAATLVARGLAQRAVLIEPLLLCLVESHWEMAEESWKVAPTLDIEALEQRSAEAESDYWGPELIDLIVAGVDPDASLVARAQVAKESFPRRMPFDKSLNADTPPGRALDDWSGPWCDPQLDVEVWLPESWGSMADALERIDGAGPVVRQPWPPAAWLLEPEKVAAALAAEVPTDH